MERTFDRRGRRAGNAAIVDVVHQHGDAERVRQQDELLALVVALMADGGQVLDRLEPLLAVRLHFADEGMQVLDGRLHHLAQARVRNVLVALEDFLGEFFAGFQGHGALPIFRARMRHLVARIVVFRAGKINSGFDREKPGGWGQPHTSRDRSTIIFSFAHWASSVRTLPSSVEAKPHCGERQSWSRATYLVASSMRFLTSSCLFQRAGFRGDQAEHDLLLALGHEAQRLEAAGPLGVVFEEIAVVVGLAEHHLGHRLVPAFRNPGGAEVAAAHMRGDDHVGRAVLDRRR